MKLSDSVRALVQRISKIITALQLNEKINAFLIAFSYLYPIILIAISWKDIGDLDINNFAKPFLLSMLFGFVSLILQAMNWDIIVGNKYSNLTNNIEIYFKTLLMRRLPGGFWHWHGRVSLYNNAIEQKSNKIGKANTIEFLGLVLSGATTFLLVEHFYWGWVLFIFSYLVMFHLEREKFSNDVSKYLVPLILLFSYMICWFMGGLILDTLLTYISPTISITLLKSISFWVITGTVGTVFFFMPVTGIFRELTLTALLSPYLDFSKIILLSLLIRVILYLGDVSVSLIGLGIIAVNNKRSSRTG
ncbi:MAG: hypothetical protein P1P73_07310 [Brevefilum sp.]|nr:hypothetical protein [Brevefilum sp.]